MKTNYEVKQGDFAEDADSILSLWREGFEDLDLEAAERKLSWTYLDNPAGEGLTYLLWEGNECQTAGVQCLGLRDWRYAGTSYKSGIMADYVVGKKHRSLGPALKLLKGVISEGSKSLDIIYGFPNKKAQPVFKRAGYKELGRIGRYAKVLRTERLLKDRIPSFLAPYCALFLDLIIRTYSMATVLTACSGVKGEWSETFDKRFDRLWEANQAESELVSNRSARVLAWRFMSNSTSGDWKIFTIVNKEHQLLGYVVARIVGKVAVVGDFYAKNSGRCLQQLFLLFSSQAIKLGCDSISLEFFGSQRVRSQLDQVGFKLREDNVIYYLPCNDQLALSEELEWYVTGYDRDT